MTRKNGGATALTTKLSALPHPAPSRDLRRAVLARIAQIEQAYAAPASEAAGQATAPSFRRGWPVWATALGGVAAGVAIALSMPLGEGVPIDLALPGIGAVKAGLVPMPSETTGSLVLAASLALYVAGLFGSERTRKIDPDAP